MSFTKTLLAGAAICALCTVPALASPPKIHLTGADSAATMKIGHTKSGMTANRPSFTETITFTGTFSAASILKTPILLWGETWYDSQNCTQPANQKFTTVKSTSAAKVKHGSETSTAPCGTGVMFTYLGPLYTLTDKHARADSFASAVTAKNFVGYNLTLNANTDLTITK